jgi:hypothetical protein
MKMAEWFGRDNLITGKDLASNFVSRGQFDAAAHAVNCHDQLVDMLQKILEVYEMDYDDTDKALKLITKCNSED